MEMTRQLNEVVTHPEFLEKLEQLERTPKQERENFVREKMNVGTLAQDGVPVPEGLRAVVRVFEDPKSATLVQNRVELPQRFRPPLRGRVPTLPERGSRGGPVDPLATAVCVSVGVVVCVSVGGDV